MFHNEKVYFITNPSQFTKNDTATTIYHALLHLAKMRKRCTKTKIHLHIYVFYFIFG